MVRKLRNRRWCRVRGGRAQRSRTELSLLEFTPNRMGLSLWLSISQPLRALSPIGRVGHYGCYRINSPKGHTYITPKLLFIEVRSLGL